MSDIGLVTDAAVLCHNGKTVAAGKQRDVLRHDLYRANRKKVKVLDCSGRTVIPGFVDSHTHPAFIHPRLKDFELRTAGATYAEIAKSGGGIHSSVEAVRMASQSQLTRHVLSAFERMQVHGTTTVEAKSGYGLTLKDELKSLRAIRSAAKAWPGAVRTTLLGAHVVPREFTKNRSAYIPLVVEKMIPAAKKLKLADFVDVFCEEGAFSLEETLKIFDAAKKNGLKTRAHVGQFTACPLERLLDSGVSSLDHLDHVQKKDVAQIADSDSVATLLPGAVYFLGGKRYPDARALIRAGAALALATDFNPGTSPTPSMSFILSLACTQMKMTPAEAINAATVNGAHALGLSMSKGRIAETFDADFAIFKTKDYREICYWFGENLCERTVTGGVVTGN